MNKENMYKDTEINRYMDRKVEKYKVRVGKNSNNNKRVVYLLETREYLVWIGAREDECRGLKRRR